MSSDHPPVVILGCGYVGTRLAQSLLADGIQVRACARRVSLLEPLRELGAEVHYLDGARPHQFGPALGGLQRPVVVYSIPGVPDLPQGEAVRRAALAASRSNATAFIYLSSSAVYGRSELVYTDEWVDEQSSVALSDSDALLRLADEAAIESVAQVGLRSIILRLGAIYGPAVDAFHAARGARQRLRTGQYKLWDGGRHYFSRIYIDDLVRIIRIAGEKAPANSLYVVGDDHPCPQREYGKWLATHLKLPEPPEVDAARATGPRNIIRGRRLRNEKLKRELGLTLHYPSYRDGELAIDAAEQGTPLPILHLATPAPSIPAVPPPITPATAATPSVRAEAAASNDSAVAGVAWPRAVGAEDLGTALFGSACGVSVLRLDAESVAPVGPAYVLISGSARAEIAGQTHTLQPGIAVPAASRVQTESTAVLLAVTKTERR
jgi:nucleoside-diphosphate-sugar epimerase